MSDQIKISISLWGGGIYTSISGSYLQRRGHPQHKVKIFPNTHVTVAGSEIKPNELGWGTKKMAGESEIRFPRTHNLCLFKKKPHANLE